MEIKVYTPGSIKGLASNYAEGMMPPGSGLFKSLRNVRWGDTGLLTIRQQVENIASVASGTPRGLFACKFNGTWTLFASVYSGGKTSVYKSTNSGASWTAITASSGQYGDTRLDYDGTNDYPSAFAVVHSKSAKKDYLIVQNGFDYPVVYDGTIAAKHRDISLPDNVGGIRTRLTWGAGLTVRDGTSTTLADDNTSSRFYLSDTSGASTTANKLTLTMNSAQQNDDCSVTFSAGAALYDCRMIYLVVAAQADVLKQFVAGVKIDGVISSGPTTKTLYDPSSASYQRPEQVQAKGGSTSYTVLGYHVPADWHSANIDRIALTWVSTANSSASKTLTILAICGSNTNGEQYAVRGGCSHAITYFNSGTRAESAPIELPVETQLMTEVSATFEPDLRLPNDPVLFYAATIYYKNTTTTERDRGVDYVNVYRREAGEETAYFTVNNQIAAYSGSWAFSSGSEGDLLSLTEAKEKHKRDYSRPAPNAYILPIPISRAMVVANGRLVCGARGGEKADSPRVDTFPKIMASSYQQPFRFQEVSVSEDAFTGAMALLPDGESCMALKAVASAGGSTVYAFTESSVHQVATHSAGTSLFLTRVLGVGTCSGASVVEHRGVIYFVDNDGRVQRLAGGRAEVISIPVDDVFQAIPSTRRGSIAAAYFKDRIYFAVTPTGGTLNTRVLVFTESRDAWESLDTLGLSKDAAYLLSASQASGTYDSATGQSLYFLSSDTTANVNKYESSSGTENATDPISMTVTTGDQIAKDPNGVMSRLSVRWGRILSEGSTGTVTFSASYKRGTNGSNTGTLSDATAFDWLEIPLTIGDGNAPHASVTFSGALGPGVAVRELSIEVEDRNGAARTE